MAGKVDAPDYDAILQKHADEAEAQATRPAPLVPAESPDQASVYTDTNTQPESNPYQGLAAALQQYNQPPPGPNPDRFNQGGVGDLSHMNDAPQASTQGTNLVMAQQAPQAFDAMQGAMAGTGVQANMPVPLAPAVPPDQLQEADQTAGQQVAQDQAAEQAAQQQAAQRQKANELIQAKAVHEQNVQKAANDKIDADDAKVSGINWGNALGQGLAVAMGEYGRYLSGGKENLAVAAIDRVVKQQAEKNKLTSEEKIAAKKAALEQTGLDLKKEELKTDSILKKAQAAHLYAQVGTELEKVKAQQRVSALMKGGKSLSAEDLQILPEKDRARAVVLPDGSYGLAVSPARAKTAAETADAASVAKQSIKKLIDYADYFGNDPLKKMVDRPAIADAQSIQRQLAGSMRTLLVGPGNVSTYEHQLMNQVIRDPTAVFSMSSANKAALTQLLHKTDAAERRAYKGAGINLPPNHNDISIGQLKLANPGMTDKEAEDNLIRTGDWKPE